MAAVKTITGLDCYFSNAEVSAYITGGVPPYQYKWSRKNVKKNAQPKFKDFWLLQFLTVQHTILSVFVILIIWDFSIHAEILH